MKVGFIGLGIMGRAMSSRLIEGGHELYVHSHKLRRFPRRLSRGPKS